MTTQTATTADVTPSWRDTLVANSDKLIRFGGLAFVAGAGFAGAFRHMHDWTAEALPDQADWLCWANSVISEILPTVSFLSWRDRIDQKRKSGIPLGVFLASSTVSLIANLSATGLRIHGDKYFLAALPMLALMVLFKMVLGDLEYARKDRERREDRARRKAATIARRAEHARNLQQRAAELAAEQAAEQARNFEREQAEQAAERDRRAADHAAELERQREQRASAERLRLAELEQAAATERDRLAAEERRAERAERLRIEQQRIDAETAVFAEAERIKAEAEAERVRAEAERIRAEAVMKEQAAALLVTQQTAGRHRETSAPVAGDADVRPLRQRRPREETHALAAAALAVLPAGTPRDEAVRVVSRAIGASERYARDFVPSDWSAGSSAEDEGEAA